MKKITLLLTAMAFSAVTFAQEPAPVITKLFDHSLQGSAVF